MRKGFIVCVVKFEKRRVDREMRGDLIKPDLHISWEENRAAPKCRLIIYFETTTLAELGSVCFSAARSFRPKLRPVFEKQGLDAKRGGALILRSVLCNTAVPW